MEAQARRLTLPARLESVGSFRNFARSEAEAVGVPAAELEKLDLVLEEILVNIARYAYPAGDGSAEVAISADGAGKLHLEITDWGNPFNPLEVEPPDFSRGLADRPIGGLGVFLIRTLVSALAYRREGDRNILSFGFPAGTD
jgi:serine/threonine-protein kinase RsbW